MLENIFTGLSAVCAFVAAWLWFQSTRVKVLRGHGNPHHGSVAVGTGLEDIDTYATATEQARWSSHAAKAAGCAATLQGVALACHLFAK
jgi:hypothetical protein